MSGTATSPVALYSEPLYVSNIDMLDGISWLVDHVISVSFAVYMCRAHYGIAQCHTIQYE